MGRLSAQRVVPRRIRQDKHLGGGSQVDIFVVRIDFGFLGEFKSKLIEVSVISGSKCFNVLIRV